MHTATIIASVARGSSALLAAFLLSSAAHAAGPELVTNGGFETGDFSGYSVTAGSASVSLFGVNDLGAHNGSYAAYFGSIDSPDSISQTLTTTVGTTYTVSFFLGSVGTSGAPASFVGSFGGTTFISLTDADADFTFQPFSYTVQATSSTSVLTFSAFNDNAFYMLDDVSVEAVSASTAPPAPTPAVPEPSTYALLALGLTAVGYAARQRRPGASATR